MSLTNNYFFSKVRSYIVKYRCVHLTVKSGRVINSHFYLSIVITFICSHSMLSSFANVYPGVIILNRYITCRPVSNQKVNPTALTQMLSLLEFIKAGARNSRRSPQTKIQKRAVNQFLCSIAHQYILWYYNSGPFKLITKVL